MKPYSFRNNLNVESQISNEKLKKIYSKTKILIFPSAYESFGGVFLEALSKDEKPESFAGSQEEWNVFRNEELGDQGKPFAFSASLISIEIIFACA